MESVEITTSQGNFVLEVGKDSRAFLWLFDLAQAELAKSAMDTGAAARQLAKYSGSDSQKARRFVSTVAEIMEGKRPPDGWGIWAGQYARKFAEEKCKRDIKVYLVVLLAGLIGAGAIAFFGTGFEMGGILQITTLIASFLTIFGFYKVALLGIDLFHSRGGTWPE